MSTITSTFSTTRNLLLRLSLIGGLITGTLHFIVQIGIVFGLILKSPIISSLQYVASGAMGDAAFTGGIAAALLGLVLDFIMTTIMAGVFIFSVDRIPLLRRNVILGSILYGFGVFIVMNLIVLPLSAAPALPAPPLWLLIELVLQHVLLIGLPLGILVRQNAKYQYVTGANAMRKFTLSVFVNRPLQDVFDFLSNPANLSKWNSNFASAKWTSNDAPGLGSTYRVLAKMSGGENEGLFEITQWDPPQHYSYKSISRLPFPIESIESVVMLAPKANGTQITFESQFGLVGILKLAEGMFSKLAAKGDGANFDTAKRLLEAN